MNSMYCDPPQSAASVAPTGGIIGHAQDDILPTFKAGGLCQDLQVKRRRRHTVQSDNDEASNYGVCVCAREDGM